jgi:hypothetical protein
VDEVAFGRNRLIEVIGAESPRPSRTRWLIAAAAALLIIAVAVAGCGRTGKTTPGRRLVGDPGGLVTVVMAPQAPTSRTTFNTARSTCWQANPSLPHSRM